MVCLIKNTKEKQEYTMKKFIEEFKSFALRGNVMDMAVGVIIGGAFFRDRDISDGQFY